jgi:hypothetical protein
MRFLRRLLLCLFAVLVAVPGPAQEPGPATALTGQVVDQDGRPVEGARVRVRTSAILAHSGADGRFLLADPAAAPGREITAAAPNHVIAGTVLRDGLRDYSLVLRRVPPGDDPTYPWVTAFPADDRAPTTDSGREPCGTCHRRILSEWQGSAHARAAANPRFLAFFGGALAPRESRSCGACHVPMQADSAPGRAEGVAREGIGCDLCHKTEEIHAGRTGIAALALRRPPFGHQSIFGPLDDVPRGRDIHAPVFRESRFCAACHQSGTGPAAAYSEFDEWRASPAARAGLTCQSCHMRGSGLADRIADLGPGQIRRDPATLAGHDLKASPLAETAAMTLSARIEDGALVVEVLVENRGAGHHLPAGSPLRHMLLVLTARAAGEALALAEGPTLPGWSWPAATQPGRAFAKLLTDEAGRPAPHWRAALLAEDSRIPAGGGDRSRYRFALAPHRSGKIEIEATLLLRRNLPQFGGDPGETIIARRSLILDR